MTNIVDTFFDNAPADAGAEALTEADRGALQAYESRIERGRQVFIDVGIALLAIRDQRLYRETHKTFETYCQQRWKFSRQQASRLILAADVALEMSPMGDKIESERQVRALTQIEPEARKPVFELAIQKANGQTPTARQIDEARTELFPPPQQPSPQKHAFAVVTSTEPRIETPEESEDDLPAPAPFARNRDRELRAYYIDQDRTNITSPNIARCTAMGYAAYERSLAQCVKDLLEMGILCFDAEDGYYLDLTGVTQAQGGTHAQSAA